MEKWNLKFGDVIQLNPETVKNKMFAGCFMAVTEPKSWGAMGFVQALGSDGKPGGQAYYRASWNEMEAVGRALWMPAEDIEEEIHHDNYEHENDLGSTGFPLNR